MQRNEGFSLVELLIIVAIILIIAAIAVPALLRARVAANEAAVAADSRAVIAANEVFSAAANGYAPDAACFLNPAACVPAVGTVDLLDDQLAANNVAKQGYDRTYEPGAALGAGPVVVTYCYGSTPVTPGRSGIRGFGVDFSGVLLRNQAGGTCCAGGVAVPVGGPCEPISK